MWKWLKSLACPHVFTFYRNVYGDEINLLGGSRSIWRCIHCGREKFDPSLHGVKSCGVE
jgi:hypothetical protein